MLSRVLPMIASSDESTIAASHEAGSFDQSDRGGWEAWSDKGVGAGVIEVRADGSRPSLCNHRTRDASAC
jgi:hypothetical protein